MIYRDPEPNRQWWVTPALALAVAALAVTGCHRHEDPVMVADPKSHEERMPSRMTAYQFEVDDRPCVAVIYSAPNGGRGTGLSCDWTKVSKEKSDE